tara:strand:- start:168 stop:830 length:663 start_codon:yes stop_codon:yes gene_type:complete
LEKILGWWILMKRSINLDISYRCALECPKCRRQQSLKRLGNHGHDISIENYKKILDYFDTLNFCGSISDPVMHPKFVEFLSLAKNHKVKVSTAVSQKPMSWYEDAFEINPDAEWHFGMDGLPEESHLYRINQDGVKLFEVMQLAVLMGIKTYWQYIIFKYNQDHIEQSRILAKKYGIIFKEQHSSRWSKNDPYKPDNPDHYIEYNYDEEIKQKFQTKLYP